MEAAQWKALRPSLLDKVDICSGSQTFGGLGHGNLIVSLVSGARTKSERPEMGKCFFVRLGVSFPGFLGFGRLGLVYLKAVKAFPQVIWRSNVFLSRPIFFLARAHEIPANAETGPDTKRTIKSPCPNCSPRAWGAHVIWRRRRRPELQFPGAFSFGSSNDADESDSGGDSRQRRGQVPRRQRHSNRKTMTLVY